MAAAAEPTELELEAAAILCDLKRILRARDRRMRRQQQGGDAAPEIPSWGRRRRRSVLRKPPAVSAAAAASPDTPLAFFPDSSSVAEEDDDAARKARAQEEPQWVLQQRGVVASLSQEKADLLKQIEECRARLLNSRSANESLKQLHKVSHQVRQQEMRVVLLPQGTTVAALGLLDLNEPACNDAEEAAAKVAWAAAQERYCQAQKAAAARRRRLEILRAKVASPLVSCRTRRVAGAVSSIV